MQIDFKYTFAAFLIVSAVTWFDRGAPYLLFGRKGEIPDMVKYLGNMLPASIMVILVLYCIRNINLTSYPFGLAEIISIALIIAIQVIKKNTFLSVLLGTACYMVLIRTVFIV